MIATMALQTIPKAVIQSGKVAANEVTSSSVDISVPSRSCPRTRQVQSGHRAAARGAGSTSQILASVEKPQASLQPTLQALERRRSVSRRRTQKPRKNETATRRAASVRHVPPRRRCVSPLVTAGMS